MKSGAKLANRVLSEAKRSLSEAENPKATSIKRELIAMSSKIAHFRNLVSVESASLAATANPQWDQVGEDLKMIEKALWDARQSLSNLH